MALFEGKTPAERNKMIAAIALPIFALLLIFYMFSGPSKPTPTTTVNSNTRPGQRPTTAQQQAPGSTAALADVEVSADVVPISCCPEPYLGDGTGRNIFAFYIKPTPTPTVEPTAPPPSPTPPPPMMLAGLMPQSVFARQAGFTLQLSGDKFVPAVRVYVGGQEVPTQYKSAQQLSANVPAALISSPSPRPVIVKTPDGRLYSNEATLSVNQPPSPTYTYVGFLRRKSGNTAVLKDSKGELYSVRQGDIVEGRFRVADVSERGVEVVDKDLNIKHTMPFVDARGNPGAPGRAPGSIQPPPPDPEGGDEEP